MNLGSRQSGIVLIRGRNTQAHHLGSRRTSSSGPANAWGPASFYARCTSLQRRGTDPRIGSIDFA